METLTHDFNSFVSTQLNIPQHQAVTTAQGALLVIAGAGSGKTRVITARIANLILNHEVLPSQIVALTFTNKAAGEMKERVERFIGKHNPLPFVGTFHSYCLLLLRSHGSLLPFSSFSILDADDQVTLIKKIIKQNNVEKFATPSQVTHQISALKNAIFQNASISEVHPIMREIYFAYEKEKSASHCLDFDDLILEVLKLFQKNKEFKARFQQKVIHLLIDEYQDTSHVQHQLLKEMTLTNDNEFTAHSVCAVGDEDQSIYSWRGATVANMFKFQQDFKPVSIIKIEQNYRSVKPILDAANSIITNNRLRNPKKLWSERAAANRILQLECRSGDQEAEIIALYLKNLPNDKKLSDVAILYRTHYQSRLIEEALITQSIPYKIIGGIRFYERKEIKDLLAYLRLIVNPFDRISFLRVMNYPARGLGTQVENMVLNEWVVNPFFDFKQLVNYLCTNDAFNVTTKKQWALENFVAIYQEIDTELPPSKLLKHILDKTEYLNAIRVDYDAKEAETKLDNIHEFMQSILHFESTYASKPNSFALGKPISKEPSLDNFLHEVALLQEKTTAENTTDQVQMMTLHAAKGLEFDTVIITGLEEGLLPSSRALTTPEDLEEERRLFYVGITRAKERLILCNAGFRSQYGTIMNAAPSRFCGEITKNLINHLNLEETNSIQSKQLFDQWLTGVVRPSGLKTFSNFTKPAMTTKLAYTPSSTSTHKPFVNRSSSKSSSFGHQSATNKPTARPSSYKPVSNHVSKVQEWAERGSLEIPGPWKKNDRVIHKTFGMGIVTLVEKASGEDYFITAIFKTGTKKILSSFLTKD